MSRLLERLHAEQATARAAAAEQARQKHLRAGAQAYARGLADQERKRRLHAQQRDQRLVELDALVTTCPACDGPVLAGADRRATAPFINGERALVHRCPARRLPIGEVA